MLVSFMDLVHGLSVTVWLVQVVQLPFLCVRRGLIGVVLGTSASPGHKLTLTIKTMFHEGIFCYNKRQNDQRK